MKRTLILLILLLTVVTCLVWSGTGVQAQDQSSSISSDSAIAYVCRDGVVRPLYSGQGVGELPKGMTPEQFTIKHKMLPEQEAAIVHEVPPCPVIIDGKQYDAEQVHLFDGKRLGFTVGKDGILYAFTTEEGMKQFRETQLSAIKSGNMAALSVYSYFYEDWYYGGDYLAVSPGTYIPNLGDSWILMDNMISSLIANSAASYVRLYDYVNYGGDYFERPGGTNINSLLIFGWGDRASSIIVY